MSKGREGERQKCEENVKKLDKETMLKGNEKENTDRGKNVMHLLSEASFC